MTKPYSKTPAEPQTEKGEHSQEAWRYLRFVLQNFRVEHQVKQGKHIIASHFEDYPLNVEAIYKRIVADHNACAGMSDPVKDVRELREEVDDNSRVILNHRSEMSKLARENAELRELNKRINDGLNDDFRGRCEALRERDAARDQLASLTKENEELKAKVEELQPVKNLSEVAHEIKQFDPLDESKLATFHAYCEAFFKSHRLATDAITILADAFNEIQSLRSELAQAKERVKALEDAFPAHFYKHPKGCRCSQCFEENHLTQSNQ